MEKHTASPGMQKFFTKLLALKEFIREELKYEKTIALEMVYKKLDEIIKSTEEKK